MSQRHAAAKAARAVTGAASKAGPSTSSGSSSSSTNPVATVTWPANAKSEDIRFAKDFIKAALHGHSPIAKFQGWRNDAALQSVDPKINPLKYLNRRLIYDSRHVKTPPRKFVRQQKKLEPLKKYIRPFHTSAAPTASRRAYQEEDEEADFEGPDAALAGLEDSDGPPSLALIAAKRTLHPGDWVQIRLYGQSSGGIYLEEDKIVTARGSRRVLVHSFGNNLISVRQDDILFTIPGIVPAEIANRATRILGLSPTEYIEHLEGEGEPAPSTAAPSDIIVDDNLLWTHYGIEHGEEEWQSVFQAKSQCVAALRDMKLKQEKARAEISAKGPRRLYTHFEGTGITHITTLQAYQHLFGYTDKILSGKGETDKHRHYLLALHDVLLDDSEHFVLHSFGTLLDSAFRVRPREELDRLREVREWIRKGTAQILNFTMKAGEMRNTTATHRRLILEGHEKMEASNNRASWSSSDLKIIKFLENSLDMRRQLQLNPFEASASLLLRRIVTDSSKGLDTIERATDEKISSILKARQNVIHFLKSIGVYNEWENLVLRDKEADIRARLETVGAHGSDTAVSATPPRTSTLTATATPEENVDGLDSQRHDFGQLPVYVIDDISASELDDGISIEHCPSTPGSSSGKPETYWIHVHIADPTSSLTPTSELAQQARKYTTALYLPEFVSPMFPDEAMKRYKWSLGSREGKEERVLTFSAKVDSEGNVLEKKIRPAVVNKICVTTYDTVNDLLGMPTNNNPQSSSDDRITLSWPTSDVSAETAREDRPLSPLSSNAKEDFTLLRKISRGLLKKRIKSGYVSWHNSSNESDLSLSPRPFYSSASFGYHNSYVPPPPPHLSLTLPSLSSSSSSSSTPSIPESESAKIVAEFMILAGRIAASHLSSRGLPALFRAQDTPAVPSATALDEFLASRDQETGITTAEEQLKKGVNFSAAYFKPSAADHWSMGITGASGGYAQSTSPLRRYNDMMIHWQIKSTFNHNHQSVQQTPTNKIKPAFSLSEIEGHIKKYAPLPRILKRVEQRSRTFWRLFLLFKKWEQVKMNQSSDRQVAELLLNGLTAKVLDHRLDYASLQRIVFVTIPQLGGMLATLILDPKFEDVEQGRVFNVQIADILLDDMSKIFVKLR